MTLTSSLKKQLEAENFWHKQCIHSLEYGVEAEHAIFYGRRQVQERWAIVPVAQRFNRNPSGKIKSRSALYAMKQAKKWGLWDEIKLRYPKRDWDKDFELLNNQ